MPSHLLWIIPLALGGFVAFFSLVVKLLSLAGWQRLAAFQVLNPPPGPWFRLLRARIGVVSYKSAIRAGASAAGLALTTSFPFRAGHPPLLIPWAAMGPFQAEQFLWTTSYTTSIRLPGGSAVRLTFAGEDILAAARPWIQVLPQG